MDENNNYFKEKTNKDKEVIVMSKANSRMNLSYVTSNANTSKSKSRNASLNNSHQSSLSRIPVKITRRPGESPGPSVPEKKVFAKCKAVKLVEKEKMAAVPNESSVIIMPKSSSCAANFPVQMQPPRNPISDTRQQTATTEKKAHPLRSSSDNTKFPHSCQDKQCQTSKDDNEKEVKALGISEVISGPPQRNTVFSSLSSVFTSGESCENTSHEKNKENGIMDSSRTSCEEIHSPPSVVPLAYYKSRDKNKPVQNLQSKSEPQKSHESRHQFCQSQENRPHRYTRVPSFKHLQITRPQTRDTSAASSNNDFLHSRKSSVGAVVPRKNNRISLGHRNFSSASATYEGIFYKKKAFTEKGSASLRSRSNSSNNDAQFHAHAQQRTVLTKIITETNYEYEEEDNEPGPSSASNRNSVKGKWIPPNKAIMPKVNSTTGKVTPTDHPRILPAPTNPPDTKNSEREKDVKQISKTYNNTAPNVILPGHRDPHLELPDPAAKSDVGESTADDDKQNIRRKEHCEKCKVYKNLLCQSDATIRYLTQMLVTKDYELQTVKIYGRGIPAFGRYSGSNIPSLNPLLMREENSETSGGSTSSKHSPCATKSTTPKFDLDEFIRKYFRNLLFTKDFQDSPFTPLQLFHVAISARDCMAQVMLQKLKHAGLVLRKKYEIFTTKRSSTAEPLDEKLYFAVLESYRRFLRFFYHYFKDSINHVEAFEQAYISEKKNTEKATEPESRRVYSQEQIVTINGKRYTAVVIPIQELSPEENLDAQLSLNNNDE